MGPATIPRVIPRPTATISRRARRALLPAPIITSRPTRWRVLRSPAAHQWGPGSATVGAMPCRPASMLTTRWGPSYLAAAFAFTNYWMSIDRVAVGDHLTADPNGATPAKDSALASAGPMASPCSPSSTAHSPRTHRLTPARVRSATAGRSNFARLAGRKPAGPSHQRTSFDLGQDHPKACAST
jgi:hypothetical protein